MKRVFIIKNAPLGEPHPLSVDITSLLNNFKRIKEFEINLIISKSKNIPKKIRKLCKKIYEINSNTYSIKDNIKFIFDCYSILKRENKNKKIDILHSIYPNSSLLSAVLFKKFIDSNIKIIYEVRSPWIEMSISQGYINKNFISSYKYILMNEERILCKSVDYLIFISDGLKDYYNKTFNIKNKDFTVIPSGVDINKVKRVQSNIRKKYKIKDKEILLGYVGSIEKKRQLSDFLRIFNEVCKKNKNLKLIFVGDGNARSELEILVKEYKLNDKVIFAGKILHKEINKYISAFDYGICHLPDIFVYRNSFPLKILEYLSCGVPVLASNIKAHRDISKSLNGIFIYKKNDIYKFLTNRNKVADKKIINYSWERLAKKYMEVYKNV